MTVYEMSLEYYPRLWPIERLNELVNAERLTESERDQIVTQAAGAPQYI